MIMKHIVRLVHYYKRYYTVCQKRIPPNHQR